MKNLQGKVVLITGAGSGIGQQTAVAFAAEKTKLILLDIKQEGLDQTVGMAQSDAQSIETHICDVSDFSAMQSLADEINSKYGAVDVLINNAGIGTAGSFLDTTLETWKKTLDINLMGVVHGCKVFLPAMVARKQGGAVVNIASMAGYYAANIMPVYSASKFAVLGFSESLRADLNEQNISVSAICPGIIKTPIIASSVFEGQLSGDDAEEFRKKAVAFYEKRNYTPDRVAKAILKAVKKRKGVVPVSPEAWIAYYLKRFFPGIVAWATRQDAPF
ncbi:MAG: SDR family NAD(P)-dependent oxidoreductase [Gammaproteobacteria bacterium]|nr:SDR family NAD(P)-dependent oxidoreductase [Gammaproteobacteria bacterium]MDH3767726.1 SDR family NAD(P)-dependent oxidoreductase [Gammaproteobacteria bacterium]